jgi:biopolymer transport protein ExbB/TolQ
MQFSLTELWLAMGPLAKGVVLVLVGMSLVSFSVAVEKWLTLRRAATASTQFLQVWREAVQTQGCAGAASQAEKYPHSPVAHLLAAGAQLLHDETDPGRQLEAYDRTVRRVILTTGATIKRGLGVLATVGSTAPFVGLFGTVVGIVNAFQQMAVSGQGGLGVVSAGIAEALVTTALGIGVAIPAVWLFNVLTQRITRLLTEMECAAEELAVTALRQSPSTARRPLAGAERTGGSHGNTAWRE